MLIHNVIRWFSDDIQTFTDLRVTTMSSDDTFAAGLDLSAAWIGRNFSVKLKIKILAKNIEMIVFGIWNFEIEI